MNTCVAYHSWQAYDTMLWGRCHGSLERLEWFSQKSGWSVEYHTQTMSFSLDKHVHPLTEVKIGLRVIWRIFIYSFFVCFIELTQLLGLVLFLITRQPIYIYFFLNIFFWNNFRLLEVAKIIQNSTSFVVVAVGGVCAVKYF